jgi:guanosine-3',5'-bis(diphosphate) 3'-pyrophosphohydrolase
VSGPDATKRLVVAARELAAERHRGQARKATELPYFDHVTKVAGLLADAGFDAEVVAAGFLHDVVEHTPVTAEEIRKRFGDRVAHLVEAMTDREDIEDWPERKAEHRARVAAAGRDACAIYAADKLCVIGEARQGFADAGPEVEDRLGTPLDVRVAVWLDDVRMLEEVDPPLPFVDELATGLEALSAEVSTAPRS